MLNVCVPWSRSLAALRGPHRTRVATHGATSAGARCSSATSLLGQARGSETYRRPSVAARASGADTPANDAEAGSTDEGSLPYYLDFELADRAPVPPGGTFQQLVASLDQTDDLNQLQTALAAAILAEDYGLAGRIRDRLKEVLGTSAARIDWASLGVPDWLADRAERLAFKFPTEVQRRAAPVLLSGLDAVIQSETGSGKSLAFLVPLLARLRYPPDVFLEDLVGPQALIVVPSMELGVQVAMLIFKLFGGNVSVGRPGDPANLYTYQGPRNIKVRGVLNKEEVIMGKAKSSYLAQVHVLVGTPGALAEVAAEPNAQPILDHLLAVVIDEADECFAADPQAMAFLLQRATAPPPVVAPAATAAPEEALGGASPSGSNGSSSSSSSSGSTAWVKPQIVMVGATQQRSAVETAVGAGWMQEPAQVLVGRGGSVPSGLTHRYVVCEEGRRLAVMTRMLRQDLLLAGQDDTPARVIVFAPGPEEVAAAAGPLQSVLWEEHRMSVLLPLGDPAAVVIDGSFNGPTTTSAAMLNASEPLRALLSFRDNKSSLLLCTPQAARGLDLPAVSHVYNLGAPGDASQYLHRAGRAGRIGSTAGGVITTVLSEEELPALLLMAQDLGVQLTQVPEAPPAAAEAAEGAAPDLDSQRKGLEDVFTLM